MDLNLKINPGINSQIMDTYGIFDDKDTIYSSIEEVFIIQELLETLSTLSKEDNLKYNDTNNDTNNDKYNDKYNNIDKYNAQYNNNYINKIRSNQRKDIASIDKRMDFNKLNTWKLNYLADKEIEKRKDKEEDISKKKNILKRQIII